MSHQDHQSLAKSIVPRCAVVTLSDTRSIDTDESGQTIRKLLIEAGAMVESYQLIPDEPEQLKTILDKLLADESIDAILTNGGTGISERDQTISVIEQLIEKPLPGFGEIFRTLSFNEIGPAAMLSRAVAGVVRGKIIFAMPGSTKAVQLAMKELICKELKHIIRELRR